MLNNVFVFGMPVRSFAIRALALLLPCPLLLAGGLSPASPPPPGDGIIHLIVQALYPDNVLALIACSLLLCLPGVALVLGSDYLAEMTFARLPLNTTPGIIWRIIGYLVAMGASWCALSRALA